jgi:three-Cys-motif partner protein
MNQFGGNWTEIKMEIIVNYAKAYLAIMNKQEWAKTIYFDGFAGSGYIETENEIDEIKGTSLRILELNDPRPFDIYYFVELNEKNKNELNKSIQELHFGKNAHVVQSDCNQKLESLANFMSINKSYRALVFIDPYGMTIKWDSILKLKDLGIDLWILVPTGIGVNRLLVNDGKISDAWMNKLVAFLGISKNEIESTFYKKSSIQTLFGEEIKVEKDIKTIQKISEIYSSKLNEVFKYISNPFIMKNSTNSIMYHFMMATNNPTALKIANEIISPKYKIQ